MPAPSCSQARRSPQAAADLNVTKAGLAVSDWHALFDRSVIKTAPIVFDLLAHAGAVVICLWTWFSGMAWLTPLPWLILCWMNHAALAMLHEAVHCLLLRSRRVNELAGIAIGTLALTPMSVYRYMHARHHAHLGGVRDPEFWPYNLPSSPRWLRIGYAWLELLLGVVFTPLLYSWRTARDWRHVRARMRRRLLLEWSLLAGFWGSIVTIMAMQGWWECLVVAHIVPAWLAGTLQTVRKFAEHLGCFGGDIDGMTRTVVYQGRLGRWLSRTQLFVDHHATHHRFLRIPCASLPAATAILRRHLVVTQVHRHHGTAIAEGLRQLGDPRLGPQWLATGSRRMHRGHREMVAVETTASG